MSDNKPLAKITPLSISETPDYEIPQVPPLRREVKAKVWIGLFVLFLFFAAGGGWAAYATLSGAVIASGVVSPEGQRRTVQHLEGGIIRELLIKEGDHVIKGQPLITLSSIKAQALVNSLKIQLVNLAAKEARLLAEAQESKAIAFEHPSLENKDDPLVQSVIEQQITHFETRKNLKIARMELLEKKLLDSKEQTVGLKIQLKSIRRQQQLTNEEAEIVGQMVAKGYEKKSRLINLQGHLAGLDGQEGQLISEIARVKESIAETKIRMQASTVVEREKIEQDLAVVQEDRRKIEEDIVEKLDQLSRVQIVAPVAGKIIELRFKTIGGIITAGRPILDIVPEQDNLVIEAQVSPKDIDDVHIGQSARIMFTSYPIRDSKRVRGVVDRVSPDTIVKDETQEAYFVARIRVDLDHMREVAPNVKLAPGLPTQAFITTGERTLLDYLFDPITRMLMRSFREPA